ncbi:hypothetical protein [Tsukamurella paurometabola]
MNPRPITCTIAGRLHRYRVDGRARWAICSINSAVRTVLAASPGRSGAGFPDSAARTAATNAATAFAN